MPRKPFDLESSNLDIHAPTFQEVLPYAMVSHPANHGEPLFVAMVSIVKPWLIIPIFVIVEPLVILVGHLTSTNHPVH